MFFGHDIKPRVRSKQIGQSKASEDKHLQSFPVVRSDSHERYRMTTTELYECLYNSKLKNGFVVVSNMLNCSIRDLHDNTVRNVAKVFLENV